MGQYACLDSKTLSYRFTSCRGCRAEWRGDRCLFTPCHSQVEVRKSNRDPDNDDAKRRKRKAEKRAQGKTERGDDLPETCWNCDEICSDGIRYFCSRGLIEPMTQRQAYQARQARECEYFQLRLEEEIAAWET